MRRLLLTLPAAVLVVLLATGATPMWLTLPLGLVAALVSPGVALLDLFAPQQLRGLPGAALIAATSMGTLIVGGLLLNQLPSGLSPIAWAVGLLVVTGAATVATALRGQRVTRNHTLRGRLQPATVTKAVACLALVLVTLVVAVSSQSAANRSQPLTQLWVAPNEGSVQTVHLRNDEGNQTTYRVSIQVGDLPSTVQVVTVPNGASWSTPVQAQRDGGVLDRLVVNVYRDDAHPYRQVVLNGTSP